MMKIVTVISQRPLTAIRGLFFGFFHRDRLACRFPYGGFDGGVDIAEMVVKTRRGNVSHFNELHHDLLHGFQNQFLVFGSHKISSGLA
jgi:hypothetical protein